MGGKTVGFSMFGGYSYNERTALSLGVVDPRHRDRRRADADLGRGERRHPQEHRRAAPAARGAGAGRHHPVRARRARELSPGVAHAPGLRRRSEGALGPGQGLGEPLRQLRCDLAPGRSMGDMWPQSSMTARRAGRMRRAMASWRAGGLQVSSRPHTRSVGQRICVSTPVASGRASKARICAANFCGVQRATIARIDLDEGGIGQPRRRHHVAHPHPPHRPHARGGGEVEQCLPLARLARRRPHRARAPGSRCRGARAHARARRRRAGPPAPPARPSSAPRARSAAAPARAPPAPWRAASRVPRTRGRGSARASPRA